jgi:hypothetical protein
MVSIGNIDGAAGATMEGALSMIALKVSCGCDFAWAWPVP